MGAEFVNEVRRARSLYILAFTAALVLTPTTYVRVIVILHVAFTASPASVWVEVCGFGGVLFTELFHALLFLSSSLLDRLTAGSPRLEGVRIQGLLMVPIEVPSRPKSCKVQNEQSFWESGRLDLVFKLPGAYIERIVLKIHNDVV
jgi:hypothetical protein